MNLYQKAVLLCGGVLLIGVLLFLDGMDFRGPGYAAAAGLLALSGLIAALRTTGDERRSDTEPHAPGKTS